MTKRQYVVYKSCQDDNLIITAYVDGSWIYRWGFPIYELEDMINHVEQMGFTRAYTDLEIADKRDYIRLLNKSLENMKENRLVVTDE